MISFRYTTLLSLVVIIIAGFIGGYWLDAQRVTVPDESSTGSTGRNERSTPRSFILPSTPAVALEQELRQQSHASATSLIKCAARLSLMGYDVGDEIVSFNAKLVEATYVYQQRHQLMASGHFDNATRSSLRC